MAEPFSAAPWTIFLIPNVCARCMSAAEVFPVSIAVSTPAARRASIA